MRNPFRGSIRKSFLERSQALIGIIGIIAVLAGTAFALLLSGGFFASTYTISADFANAAGIKGSDDVLVAGLEAGSVSDVQINGGEVMVTMDISTDVELPKDVSAEILVETLMGKKSVSLYGGTDDAGMLEDGDHIALENTRTPVELLDLQDTSVPLLEKSDAEAFESFMVSITKITQGKERQITRLLRGFADTAKAIDQRSQELARLIDSFRIVSAAFADKDDVIISLIDRFDVVLTNLAERREDIERLLVATDQASHETANLVSRNRSDLDGMLRQLHEALDVINQHQIDLAGIISYLHDAVKGYQSVGYSHGVPNRWANIFVQSLGPLGVDAIAGECGLIDQALDRLLGPEKGKKECKEDYGAPDDRNDDSGPGASSAAAAGGGGSNGSGSPAASGDADDGGSGAGGDSGSGSGDLPNDVGDLVDSVTGDDTASETMGGGLE